MHYYLKYFVVVSIGSILLVKLAESARPSATGNGQCILYTNGVCLPKGYNELMQPEQSMNVHVYIRIEQIEAINDARSEIDLMATLSLLWKDYRLTYKPNNTDPKQQLKEGQKIPLNTQWIDWMWVPDMYIYQMRSVNAPELMQNPFMGVSKC